MPERSPARRRPAGDAWPRSVVFALAYFAVWAVFTVWRLVAIELPGSISSRYRERHHRRLWNATIGAWSSVIVSSARWLLDLRLEVEGAPPEGRHIVVANHQALADIVMLMHVLRPLAVKPVVLPWLATSFPTVSYTVRNAGFGVVDLADREHVLGQVVAFAKDLSPWNGSPLIYPEGRRSDDGTMHPFRRAGLQLLVRSTRLPVLPVIVDGLWEARHFREMPLYLPHSRARVRILDPIPAEAALRGIRTLPEDLEARMRRELDAMRAQPARA